MELKETEMGTKRCYTMEEIIGKLREAVSTLIFSGVSKPLKMLSM